LATIIDLFGKFKTDDEKMAFLEAQLATITTLNKQLEQEKLKTRQLEQLLKEKVPAIDGSVEKNTIPYEEQICLTQLSVLNDSSKSRELTAEEARKVEIYSKILIQAKNKDIKKPDALDKLDTKELLKLVQNEPPKIG